MIEINLLPGSVKRTKRKVGVAFPGGALDKLKLPPMDKYLFIAIGMWVVGLALLGYMQIGGTNRLNAATIREKQLINDTARLSSELAAGAALTGKRDTIVQKLAAIQELDAGRFRWAHIFDEIGRALPEYTWLISILPGAGEGTEETFRIEGRMANAFALPKFMTELEASPFIKNVELLASPSVIENGKSLYSFQLEAQWEEPPLELIQTQPLFGPDMQPDSAMMADIAAKKAANTAPPAPPAPVKPPGKPGKE